MAIKRLATLAAVLTLLPASAQAQTSGFDVDRFAASGTSGGYLSIEAPLRDAELVTVALQGGYLDTPLVLVESSGVRHKVVSSRSTITLMGRVAPLPGLEIGAEAPFVAQQTGMDYPTTSVIGNGLGDIRVIPKWTLLDRAIGVAVLVPVRLPTGDVATFKGAGRVVVEPMLALQGRGGPVRMGINAGWRPGPSGTMAPALATRTGDQFFGGVGAGVRVMRPVELLAELNFATEDADTWNRLTTPVEATGGVRYDRGPWSFLAGGGAGVVNGYGAAAGRAFVQVSFHPLARHEEPVVAAEPVPAPSEPAPPVAAPAAQGPAPEADEVLVTQNEILVLHPIFFELNSAEIRPRFEPALEKVAEALGEWRGIVRVRIEGHADLTGPHRWNEELSRMRAEAICEWLVAHGVAARRLVPMGFAEGQPWTTNATAGGRARNRRVMFHIEKWAKGAPRPDVTEPSPEEVQP